MTTDNTALEQYREGSLDDRHRFARALATAGDLIPKALHAAPVDEAGNRLPGQPVPSAGKVLLVLETGAMLGLPPVAALQGIQVIEGKATLSAGMMSAVVRRAGHRLHITEEGTVEGGDLKVTATLTRTDDDAHPFTSVWTPHKAARAGLCRYQRDEEAGIWRVYAASSSGAPKPWQAYTEAMCRSRSISEVCRMGAEDALYGVHYTPEELAEGPREEVAVATVTEDQAPEPAKTRRRAPAKGKQGTRRATEEPKPEEEPVEAEVVEEGPSPSLHPSYAEAADVSPEPKPSEPDVPMYAEEVGPTDDGDVPPEEDGYSLQSPEVVDERTGKTYASQAEMDAALKAEHQARQAEREQAPEAPTEGGDVEDKRKHWLFQVSEAQTVAQVKAVWDETYNTPVLDTELRMAIIARKAKLEDDERKRAEAAQA